MAEPDDAGGRTTYSGPVDWCFRSRTTGRLVLGQTPNVPIILWAVTTVLGWFIEGRAGAVLAVVAAVGLGWWAVEELARGVNPFRRMLGAGALLWISLGLLGVR